MVQIKARIHRAGRERCAVIKIRLRDVAPLLFPIVSNCDGVTADGGSITFHQQLPRASPGEVAIHFREPRGVVGWARLLRGGEVRVQPQTIKTEPPHHVHDAVTEVIAKPGVQRAMPDATSRIYKFFATLVEENPIRMICPYR